MLVVGAVHLIHTVSWRKTWILSWCALFMQNFFEGFCDNSHKVQLCLWWNCSFVAVYVLSPSLSPFLSLRLSSSCSLTPFFDGAFQSFSFPIIKSYYGQKAALYKRILSLFSVSVLCKSHRLARTTSGHHPKLNQVLSELSLEILHHPSTFR